MIIRQWKHAHLSNDSIGFGYLECSDKNDILSLSSYTKQKTL